MRLATASVSSSSSSSASSRLRLTFTLQGAPAAAAVAPLAWLLDHDPARLHATSGQRTGDAASVPRDLDARDVEVEVARGGEEMRVRWRRGGVGARESVFSAAWLAENVPSEDEATRARRRSPRFGIPAPTPWRSLTREQIPTVSATRVNTSVGPNELTPVAADVLEALARVGVALVTDMPDTAKGTEAVVRALVGPPRETFYGEMWDTAPRKAEDVNDTAYTKEALDGHTDTTYLADSPGLQCFNCVAQSGPPSAADEGATKLLDGMYLASRLKQEDPAAYAFFKSTPLVFHHVERGVNTRHTAPVILTTPGSAGAGADAEEFVQMRYNSYDLAPLSYLTPDEADAFYRAHASLTRLVRDRANMALVKLRVGDMVIVDNHRVLHGRTAFKGYRNLVGCYVGVDDWRMRCRAAQSELRRPSFDHR